MFGHSPPPVARAIRRQAGPRPDLHAARRGRAGARPAAGGALRPARMADRDHRDRRQPLCAARRPRRHRPAERSWSSTAAITAPSTRRWCGWSTARPVNRPGLAGEFRDLTAGDQGRRVQRHSGAGKGACRQGRRLRHHRAGADQFLHGAARSRLSRRAAPADPQGRHAAADRRDAHHLDRPRRLHQALRPGARPVRARQADRRRRAGERLGHERRTRQALPRLQCEQRSRAIPAWAPRCRPTRCSSPPCARRWKR